MNPDPEPPPIFSARGKTACGRCQVPLSASHHGVQQAKSCTTQGLGLPWQGRGKMLLSSGCSAHAYDLLLSLDCYLCFKMEQQVMLSSGTTVGSILPHSFHMAAEQAEDSSSLCSPSSNPSSAGSNVSHTLLTVEASSAFSDQCSWWDSVERLSWSWKGAEGIEKWHSITGVGAGRNRGHLVSVLRPAWKNCS